MRNIALKSKRAFILSSVYQLCVQMYWRPFRYSEQSTAPWLRYGPNTELCTLGTQCSC